ncbi:MAG: DUF721 domain-containing protein [Gammaproteobacteria bacterium]|nr:DUF721 domain-containing protein [Gammaproteobacteria bacterium]
MLQSGTARLSDLSRRARAAVSLRDELQSLLPASLQPHLAHASERRGEVTLWVDSAAFCARLRFESPHLRESAAALLQRPISRILVRVQPRGASQDGKTAE